MTIKSIFGIGKSFRKYLASRKTKRQGQKNIGVRGGHLY
jgi:hypothetical protein